MRKRDFTFVDLFAGAGGFTEGMLLAGSKGEFRIAAASDVHPQAERNHLNRFRGQLGFDYEFITRDIRDRVFNEQLANSIALKVGPESVDVVVGGPPCQGFSLFGARRERDPRNDLFRPYLDAIKTLRPKYFVMENVPGLAMIWRQSGADDL